MSYYALLPMEVAGTNRKVEAGDPVPEASKWHNLRMWMKRGHVAYVVDGKEREFVDALLTGGDAAQYAPMTAAHYLAGAARRLQYGAGPGASASPLAADVPAPSAPVAAHKHEKKKGG